MLQCRTGRPSDLYRPWSGESANLGIRPSGKLLKSFGVGLFAYNHGFTIDRDGNLWVTDVNDQETILGMPARNAAGVIIGQESAQTKPAR